jgi:hypothetical protein
MSVLPDEVADHLDTVVAATRLLPSTDRVQALDTAVSVLLAEQAVAARDLAVDGSLDGSGCKTPNSWLRVHLRRGIGAHRIARRAELLPDLPGFAAAFAAGRVSEEHLDTVARWTKPCGLAVIQDHEATLVELAEHASPKELEQALGLLAELGNPDRDADQVAALADRFLKVHRLGDLVHVDAMVEPAVGEALQTVLILAQIGLAAAALGTRYSLATAKIVLLFGAWMLWMAVLVVVLWQRLNVGKPAQGLQPSGLGEQSSGRPG